MKNSQREKNEDVNSAGVEKVGKQNIVLQDTRFWVPEVYNSIVQPTADPLKKVCLLVGKNYNRDCRNGP